MRKIGLCLAFVVGAWVGTAQAAEMKAAPAEAAKGAAGETCGQHIASMAHIPAKLSEGAASVADMLEAHAAIMGKDKDSQAEVKGLRAIAKTHKQIAANMLKASEEMKKASTWPGAPHDMAKMSSDPKVAETSKKMLAVHKEIIAMFQKMVADMEAQSKKAK